eukprot:XP_005626315.1 basic proline-rich protein-like [Canis lupus familiaris]
MTEASLCPLRRRPPGVPVTQERDGGPSGCGTDAGESGSPGPRRSSRHPDVGPGAWLQGIPQRERGLEAAGDDGGREHRGDPLSSSPAAPAPTLFLPPGGRRARTARSQPGPLTTAPSAPHAGPFPQRRPGLGDVLTAPNADLEKPPCRPVQAMTPAPQGNPRQGRGRPPGQKPPGQSDQGSPAGDAPRVHTARGTVLTANTAPARPGEVGRPVSRSPPATAGTGARQWRTARPRPGRRRADRATPASLMQQPTPGVDLFGVRKLAPSSVPGSPRAPALRSPLHPDPEEKPQPPSPCSRVDRPPSTRRRPPRRVPPAQRTGSPYVPVDPGPCPPGNASRRLLSLDTRVGRDRLLPRDPALGVCRGGRLLDRVAGAQGHIRRTRGEPATLIDRCPAGGRDEVPAPATTAAAITRPQTDRQTPSEGRTPKQPRVRCRFPSVWRSGRGHLTPPERNRCSRIAPASCKAREARRFPLALILSHNPSFEAPEMRDSNGPAPGCRHPSNPSRARGASASPPGGPLPGPSPSASRGP